MLGILWGFLFFSELRQAGWRRWMGVVGGAMLMCLGVAVLAAASAAQAPASAHALKGVWAALGAGILWGTMYIPYRKVYLTGMNPLAFVTFFTFGELGMMAGLAISYTGLGPLWKEVVNARAVTAWLMPAGAFRFRTRINFGDCCGVCWSSESYWEGWRHVCGGYRRISADDARRGCDCTVVGHRRRTDALAGGGAARERSLRRGGGLRGSAARWEAGCKRSAA